MPCNDLGFPAPPTIELSDDAKQLWLQWHKTYVRRVRGRQDRLRAAFSKLEAYSLRFALVFHAILERKAPPRSESAPPRCTMRSG